MQGIKKKILKKLKRKKVLGKADKILLVLFFMWLSFGFAVFVSSSLGLLTKDTTELSSAILKQGSTLLLSLFLFFIIINLRFKYILAFAPVVYFVTLVLTTLVFVPAVGLSSGGASRWIYLFGFTLQPGEFLKYSTALFAIYLLYRYRNAPEKIKILLPAIAALLPIVLLYLQPDNSTLLIVLFAVAVIYFLSGIKFRYLLVLFLAALSLLSIIIFSRPYVKDRLMVYLKIKEDHLGAGYQINQSLVAIGSGGLWGKGFGQGVQKYGYLPEPATDSVFATLAEELGLVGAFVFILIIVLFVLRAFKLAELSKSFAASLTIASFASILFIQSFVNIAAMTEMMPLTGLTLPFVSLGGSSLLSSVLAVATILSASKS